MKEKMLPSIFRSGYSNIGYSVMSKVVQSHFDAVSTVQGAVCLMHFSNIGGCDQSLLEFHHTINFSLPFINLAEVLLWFN